MCRSGKMVRPGHAGSRMADVIAEAPLPSSFALFLFFDLPRTVRMQPFPITLPVD